MLTLPLMIGPEYDVQPDDLVGSRDSRYPRLVLDDHGIAAIVRACDDADAQVDKALEATSTLYPPLVCKVSADSYGGVVIPVIQN